MVTIKDVARVANVSPSTVSRVVRGQGKVGKKCRAKVQKVIDQMGYRPNITARALVSRKSELVGIITPDLYRPFFGSIAYGSEKACREKGYQILMRNSQNKPEFEIDAINSFREHGCENIVLHSKFSTPESLISLADSIKGLVLINRFIPEIGVRCIWLDNVAGGKMAAGYLLDKGHTDIAIVSFNSKNEDQIERIEGARQAFQMRGLSIPDDNLFFEEFMPGQKIDFDDYCARAVKKLLASETKFTAVFAYNDEMAVGVMNALLDQGIRVPEDISVIGFDDMDLSQKCRPKLTTIKYPIVEMSEYATKLSLRLTSGEEYEVDRTHLFIPSLVERKSVKNFNDQK